MDRTSIEQRTNQLLAREFEIDEDSLVTGARLFEDLGLDSLDIVDLIAALEREFGATIDRQQDEKTLRAMRTLDDVHAFIASKLGSAAGQQESAPS
jgi:acyl carrier protein